MQLHAIICENMRYHTFLRNYAVACEIMRHKLTNYQMTNTHVKMPLSEEKKSTTGGKKQPETRIHFDHDHDINPPPSSPSPTWQNQ